MDRRDKPRFPADLVVRVTDLEGTSEAFAGSVVDISESGVCVLLSLHLMAGSTVKLELDDAVLYGHVTYAFGADTKFRTGIAIESVLVGTSDLSKILQVLLDSAPHTTLRSATP